MSPSEFWVGVWWGWFVSTWIYGLLVLFDTCRWAREYKRLAATQAAIERRLDEASR